MRASGSCGGSSRACTRYALRADLPIALAQAAVDDRLGRHARRDRLRGAGGVGRAAREVRATASRTRVDPVEGWIVGA